MGLQRRSVPGISDEGELKVGEPEAASRARASCKHHTNPAALTVAVVDSVLHRHLSSPFMPSQGQGLGSACVLRALLGPQRVSSLSFTLRLSASSLCL